MSIHVSRAQVVYGDRFNNPVSVCQNDATALDENLAVYNGEILIGNVNPDRNYVNNDDNSYLYSWTTYTDTSLSQIYTKFGKKQMSAGAPRHLVDTRGRSWPGRARGCVLLGMSLQVPDSSS